MNTRKIQKLVRFIQNASSIYYERGALKHMVGYLYEMLSYWTVRIPAWYFNQEKCAVTHNPKQVVLSLGHDSGLVL
jgi:hypothetical protein